ncbi:galactokinase [Azospirillum soli]|uniref:galactokinase n=1 Tax=Azospirillum soli TaxID=1304799 RepID=UPI001AE2964F|nr:galactokinase [Azospirillum soli]MBP2314370.1 galactokinase [Azospirillum soli]
MTASARAPARANLLGEHTDYNDGFVLPTPLPYFTTVTVAPGNQAGMIEAFAARFGQTLVRPLDAPRQGDWLDYPLGCVTILRAAGIEVPALRLTIESDIPMGAGISSSAALEVATLRALRRWLDLPLDDEKIALLGQRAESEYVGMPCGIMDQMVSSLGTPGQALFLDTRSLAHRLVALPSSHQLAVVHSGVTHKLTEGGYRQRRSECERAAAALGVPSLRDINDLSRIDGLPEPLNHRAHHVVTENRRVLDGVAALERGDVAAFGQLMVESHASQRDDYAVSVPEIDALVDSALHHGALGARLTGGGFGGCIVALIEDVEAWWPAVQTDNPRAKLVFPRSDKESTDG